MALSQPVKMLPPELPKDKELKVHTLDLQRNLESLFRDGHVHMVRDTVPGSREGQVGDIIPYYDGTTARLYIKVAKTVWAYVALTT